jgi:hypothetical protein
MAQPGPRDRSRFGPLEIPPRTFPAHRDGILERQLLARREGCTKALHARPVGRKPGGVDLCPLGLGVSRKDAVIEEVPVDGAAADPRSAWGARYCRGREMNWCS